MSYTPLADSITIPGAYPTQQETQRQNKYETTLPVRLDYLAAGAYLVPPLSAIVLLILEQKNDYTRFHAWQSLLLSCCLFTILFFVGLFMWKFLVVLFGIGIAGIFLWLAWKAYSNCDSLEREEAPIIGKIAAQWVESE